MASQFKFEFASKIDNFVMDSEEKVTSIKPMLKPEVMTEKLKDSSSLMTLTQETGARSHSEDPKSA